MSYPNSGYPASGYPNYPPAYGAYQPPPNQYGGIPSTSHNYSQPPQPLLDPYGRRYDQPPAIQQQQQHYPRVEDPRVPPQEIENNPHAFRRYFDSHLANLTFNSKPVITDLTLLAHRHVMRMGPIVAACLEDHLRNVSVFLSYYI